jgi:hypothetical protein
MFQKQNNQQENKLQLKTKEEAIAASFVMPAIRTMADDLAEANNPASVSVPISTPVAVVPPPLPAPPATVAKVTNTPVEVVRAAPNKSFERSFNKTPTPVPPPTPAPTLQRPTTNPMVNNVVKVSRPEPQQSVVSVPKQHGIKNGRAIGFSVLVGILIALVLCVAGWAGWTYWPRNNATIADKIPAETLAFISFHRGAGASEKILPKILEQLKLSENSLGSQWSDLVYGILPGSTSSDTIPFLLLADGGIVDLSGTDMTSKKLANGSTVVVDNAMAGRLDGLGGKSLGENSRYKSLASNVPKSAEYLYMNQEQTTSIAKTFTYLSPNTDYPVLFSLTSGGENVLAISGNKGVDSEWAQKQIAWDKLLKAIPADILSATGGTNLSKSIDTWRLAQSDDPKMQEFLNGLNDQGSVLEKIRADLTGVYVAGGMLSTNLLPDGVAVLEIKDGATDDLKTQMSSMEGALTKLGSMIGGASYTDAAFTDSSYKEVPIRFVNFGDSSHSFDYAIIDSMLLVSNSKNSMQKMIDVYKGEDGSFGNVVSARDQMQANWQYVLFNPDTLDKLPSSLKTFLSGFTSLFIEPTGTKTLSGSIAF